jgi:hydroxyacylglutathione hydrolase
MLLEILTLGSYQTNCYIFASDVTKNGILIDPASAAPEIIDRLERLSIKVGFIVLTHGHPDHAGALKQLKEYTQAEFAMHKADVPILNDRLLNTLLGFKQLAIEPDRMLEDGETLTLDGLSLNVVHTPGHTPGGICLLGKGLLFSGDTLFNMSVGRTDLPGGNSDQLTRSIRNRLMKLTDDTVVYPGHGPATTIGEERLNNPFLG